MAIEQSTGRYICNLDSDDVRMGVFKEEVEEVVVEVEVEKEIENEEEEMKRKRKRKR